MERLNDLASATANLDRGEIVSGMPLELAALETEADYILYSPEEGVISEHFTPSEAAMAYYEIASRKQIGERLPAIYRRSGENWEPVR